MGLIEGFDLAVGLFFTATFASGFDILNFFGISFFDGILTYKDNIDS